ncbi:cell wall-associated protein [Listeria innocua FSL J1-023]|nr:cell wall-associated protein [Listeria innocua FSL J1-023]
MFTAYDPDPGDEDDPQTMNGYNYANNNPVMYVDPDGHWVWLAINAGFAAYDGYKTYKKTKSWKKAGLAAGSSALGGGKFKLAKKAVGGAFRIGKRATGKHSVYTLNHKVTNKPVYVGRTKNTKSRARAHAKKHPDTYMSVKKSGLSYSEARGLEHRYYLKLGGKKKLRNKIRPVAKKNKRYGKYMSKSRKYWR